MGTVTTSLRQQAQSIFDDLGYSVSRNGGEIQATRKWRTVEVTPMPEPEDPPASGEMRCFVTWAESAPALERRLQQASPEYEWAVIGVEDGDEYAVVGRSHG